MSNSTFLFLDETNSTNSSYCQSTEPYSLARLWIVGLATPVAIIAIPMNLLLFCVLIWDRVSRNSVKIYIAALSALDIYISAMYIVMCSMDAIVVYWRLGDFYGVYMNYIFPVLATCNIIQFTSKYVLIFATIDRFVAVAPLMSRFKPYLDARCRQTAIGAAFVLAMFFRACTFWDYKVIQGPECPPMENWLVVPMLTNQDNVLYYNYNVYALTVFTHFIPFTILLLLNTVTVYCLREEIRSAAHAHRARSTKLSLSATANRNQAGNELTAMINIAVKRSRLNAATYSLLALVTSYLACNSLEVFIKLSEQFWRESLLVTETGESTQFYTFSTDIISVLVVLNCFLRLPLCYACDSHVRVRCLGIVSCGRKHRQLRDEKSYRQAAKEASTANLNVETPTVSTSLLSNHKQDNKIKIKFTENDNSPQNRWKRAAANTLKNNNDIKVVDDIATKLSQFYSNNGMMEFNSLLESTL